jgi:hypothetical protein
MTQRKVLRRVLGLVFAGALLALSSIPAFAATTAPVTGTFSINSTPGTPVVTLTDASTTPYSNHVFTVQVTDADTIDDIQQVVMKFWYDSNGGTPLESEFNSATASAANGAVVTWTKSGQSAVAPVLTPGSTTWSLVTYTVPTTLSDRQGTTFTWSFTIRVGKVATVTDALSRWQIGAKATDNATAYAFGYDATNAQMNWYGEISGPSGTLNWGTVAPGTAFNGTGSQKALGQTVTLIANGPYDEKVSTVASWPGASYTATYDETGVTGSAQQFSLKSDDTATYASSTLVTLAGSTIDDTGVQTTESGDTNSTYNLWIKLANSFSKDTYSGTITFVIATGS